MLFVRDLQAAGTWPVSAPASASWAVPSSSLDGPQDGDGSGATQLRILLQSEWIEKQGAGPLSSPASSRGELT